MTKYHIGVDLHKTVVQVCVLDAGGKVAKEFRASVATREEADRFLGRLELWAKKGRCAVEAVGCNRWFVNALTARGCPWVVVHPGALALKREKRKTDRRDAEEIARRLYLGDIDRHGRSCFASDKEYGRRQLLRSRQALMRRRQEVMNHIRAMLNAELIRPPQPTLTSTKTLAWLPTVELSTPDLTFTLGIWIQELESVVARIGQLDRHIATLKEEPDVRPLCELPEVAVYTASVILYELGDPTRFGRTREVAAYAGVAPSISQSGEGPGHTGAITKRGSPHLRWILSQWAVRLLARHKTVQRWAARQRARSKNKIRLALARRLLVGTWVMLARGEIFDLERCLGLKPAA